MKQRLVALAAVAVLGLSACVPAVFVAGAAVGALVGSDPRNAQTIKSDIDIGAGISARVIDTYRERAHVNVNVFNGRVLLTGELPDEAARQNVAQVASTWPGARVVYNETVAAPPSTPTERLNDTQLTARVKATILSDAGNASALHFLVTTERGTVYLMGLASAELTERAARSASYVQGVNRVVKYVEVMPEQQNK
ncbi:BON domain-containing protein [Chitiniphilus purpureus]|uniref:BON domain-containing protein n=1 Tax=Chitiniphilus purpureus TaxID=2981137 RepID=A0ABY6DUK9_9NEIS|nr:BON domain-containing protein [Chitiniphilus sp. CD1]UXY16746.1 BON domain-containing protein [Chitiniphilus sp. CD1]